jgi:hypothetical protein
MGLLSLGLLQLLPHLGYGGLQRLELVLQVFALLVEPLHLNFPPLVFNELLLSLELLFIFKLSKLFPELADLGFLVFNLLGFPLQSQHQIFVAGLYNLNFSVLPFYFQF